MEELYGKVLLVNYREHIINHVDSFDGGYHVYFSNGTSSKGKSFDNNDFNRLLKGEILTRDGEDIMLKEPVNCLPKETEITTLKCVFSCRWNLDYNKIEPKLLIGEDLGEFNPIISIVMRDFAHKICKVREDNPYSMPMFNTHTFIYQMINRRWEHDIDADYKKIFILTESEHHITNYIKDMVGENPKTIRRWCGGGEFPFIEVFAFRFVSNETGIAYRLAR